MLDLKTVVAGYMITNMVCLCVVILLWRQSRARFPGIVFFVYDYLFQTVSMMLILLRGTVPDFVSFIIANLLVLTGALSGLVGLGYFCNRKVSLIPGAVMIGLFLVINTVFTYVTPDLHVRSLVIASGLFVICVQCVIVVFGNSDREILMQTRPIGVVFVALALVSFSRIIESVSGIHTSNDYFHSGVLDSAFIISYQILLIFLMYVLVLAANRRLMSGLRFQEEKYSKAFHSSPYALTITRMSDGLIVESNEGFYEMTGFSSENVIGRTTAQLNMWSDMRDRESFVSELMGNGSVHEREVVFRKKTGENMRCLIYAEIILINNEKYIIQSFNDITAQKNAEQALVRNFEEKKILLRELQHRAKNSFALIMGMVNVAAGLENASGAQSLESLASRIRAISDLYDLLYSTDSISDIPLDMYLEKIVSSVEKAGTGIDVLRSLDRVVLPVKLAASIGIVVAELLTNAIKYAFPDIGQGEIRVSLHLRGSSVHLEIRDNGIGMSDFELSSAKSFGLQMVWFLVTQAKGSVRLEHSGGTTWIIDWPVDAVQ